MSNAARMRLLALGVLSVAAALVAASRLAGRLAVETPAPGGARGDGTESAPPAPGQAGAAAGIVPDLSFYRELGAAGGSPGRAESPPEPLQDPGGRAGAEGGAYIVQVLATRDARQARRLKERLAKRGLPATVVEGRMGDAPIYRVRVGRYRERRAAVRLTERLRAEEGLTPWILQETR